MKGALLGRFESNSEVTLGAMCDAQSRKPLGAVLERPWLENARGVSCVPAGTYLCRLRFSPKHDREVYELQNVPGRDDVEIHIGNVVDDTQGCLLIGSRVGRLNGKSAVLESAEAFEKFMAWAGGEDFELVIEDPKTEVA